jgi:hypothetical protein
MDINPKMFIVVGYYNSRKKIQWDFKMVSLGLMEYLATVIKQDKWLVAGRILLNPITRELVLDPKSTHKMGKRVRVRRKITYVETIYWDRQGPFVEVQRGHMLCLSKEVSHLTKVYTNSAMAAREAYLVSLVTLQQLKADGELNSDAMLEHIKSSSVENLVPNPGDKVEMYSFKDDIPINPTN